MPVGVRGSGEERKEAPLAGLRILVTRPRDRSREAVALLERHGAQCLVWPLIAIAPPSDPRSLLLSLARIGEYDWLVFTSANAVRAVRDALALLPGNGVPPSGWPSAPDPAFQGEGASAPNENRVGRRSVFAVRPRVCSVGPSTTAALRDAGMRVDLEAREHRAEGVVAALEEAGPLAGSRVLFPCSDRASDVVPEGLRRRGALVDVVVAYRTVGCAGEAAAAGAGIGADAGTARGGLAEVGVPGKTFREGKEAEDASRALQALRDGSVDVVIFASPSAVSAFVDACGGDEAARDTVRQTLVAVIGPKTADAVRAHGLEVAVMPEVHTMPALVQALCVVAESGGIPTRAARDQGGD